ncbi:hypothetical protein [Actinomycetospora sp.]|jgi:hypothetical protein|uniref:hypothetical protein n=1 Tax=Actinomycetospora sp. TaxID=1872135 RepID=UPI002F41F60A
MLVAVLIPVLLLVATMLMEKFETRLLDTRTHRRPVRGPLRLEAAPTRPIAQRHLQSVTEPAPIVLDAGPVRVVDQLLPRAS